jgi:hypothetical protein
LLPIPGREGIGYGYAFAAPLCPIHGDPNRIATLDGYPDTRIAELIVIDIRELPNSRVSNSSLVGARPESALAFATNSFGLCACAICVVPQTHTVVTKRLISTVRMAASLSFLKHNAARPQVITFDPSEREVIATC